LRPGEGIFSRLESAGRAAENAVLVIILTGMILLAAGQIVMRNFLNIGFIWGDELLRMLVLWIAVAGAVAASRSDKHINIAILDRFLPAAVAGGVKVLIDLFTAAISGVVCWFSIQFVRTSHEFGDTLLGDVPAWILQLVLPVGFGLISYRYVLFAVKGTIQLARRGEAA
jgi:TRAP-type C4-dicarboxylate transport system permease small subunit